MSSWTRMLDLVGAALKANGFQFVRIDGSKSEIQRRKAINEFRTNLDCPILLASIGSAGLGLDLTAASRVHILEPLWSPMAEQQAIDRIHRLGQTLGVVATRYIVQDSIEEYIVAVQNAKTTVIRNSIGESVPSVTDKNMEHLVKYIDELPRES
ncbi:MAG: hypothetical protein M1822_005699 [Bathelium mastoideum]|nr:MAG: hypothetical protein M1822_005699 [Bathelium mastoideum]